MSAAVDDWAWTGWRTMLIATTDDGRREAKQQQYFYTARPSRDQEILDFGLMPNEELRGTIRLIGFEPGPVPFLVGGSGWIELDAKRFSLRPVPVEAVPVAPVLPVTPPAPSPDIPFVPYPGPGGDGQDPSVTPGQPTGIPWGLIAVAAAVLLVLFLRPGETKSELPAAARANIDGGRS